MTPMKLSLCLLSLLALGACASAPSPTTSPASTPSPEAEASPLPDPLEAGWQGESVCEVLHEDERQRVLRCTFPPGVGHERHYHAPHFGYVLAGGQMRITDADGTREVDLATGRSWHSDGVAWHEVVNIGDSTSIYLIVEPK